MTPIDDWVDGFDHEGEEFRMWASGEAPPPHHAKWNEALQKELDKKTADWPEGQTGEFEVFYRVSVVKRNPGWVDGYKVDLRP